MGEIGLNEQWDKSDNACTETEIKVKPDYEYIKRVNAQNWLESSNQKREIK